EVVARRRKLRQLEVVEAAAETLLDQRAHAFRPDVVDHELEARLDAGDAIAKVFAPLVEDRSEHRDRVLLGHPDPEVLRDPRHRREAAADEYTEAFPAVADCADQSDAVDL